MLQKLSLVLSIKMLDLKELYNLEQATLINKNLNKFLLSFYNKHEILEKTDQIEDIDEYRKYVNWCILKANRRFINIEQSTLTKHKTENKIEKIEVLHDKIVFNLFFSLNNTVNYELYITFKNNILKIGGIIFDHKDIDTIYKDLSTNKETLNIAKIHFPMINEKRHLQFLSGDEKTFIIDISDFISLIKKDLLNFKRMLNKIITPGRPDMLD
uniref:Uncharacterized protein n=1 Tax=viral metagenome TaxID=1070528 RepID=A0A6C0AEV4_9ZZZZ